MKLVLISFATAVLLLGTLARSQTESCSLHAAAAVQRHTQSAKPTAVLVLQDGHRVVAGGDIARKVNVASIRKSLLGSLYGIAISRGEIRLESTLAELGVDDREPKLTEEEKQATVEDLLMARSGVYHPASYETADIRKKRPKRGSHSPGTFWFYNNWDFNALGSIYRQQTGEDIFESFAKEVAAPIGMEDFTSSDGEYVSAKSSDHAAYPFRMSARDLARFGQLYLNRGTWAGKEIVPAEWIEQSLQPYSETDRKHRKYGYLWWTLRPDDYGPGAAFASGFGGQALVVLPAHRLVAVQLVDPADNPLGIRSTVLFDFLGEVISACP